MADIYKEEPQKRDTRWTVRNTVLYGITLLGLNGAIIAAGVAESTLSPKARFERYIAEVKETEEGIVSDTLGLFVPEEQ